MKKKVSFTGITIFMSIVIIAIVSNNLKISNDKWKGIIESDAKGYYAYLPAVFLYNDLNFNFIEEVYKDENNHFYYDFRVNLNDKKINKYYCGTAIAELPFFVTAHYLSKLYNFEQNGYSQLYLISISIAAIFYLFIGLFFFNKILDIYEIQEVYKTITILAAIFGTNLFYYVVMEPGMSHVFSFAFISMFFFYTKKYFQNLETKYLIILAFILGIIFLIRPVNSLVIFIIPFISSNITSLKLGLNNILKINKNTFLSLLILLSIISIQLLIYKISTGNFFVYSYQKETFNFLNPHFIDILFSYKKGLFLYTPMYFVALMGFFFLWRTNKFEFFSLLFFFSLITYVFSSWWMWYYGGSFSSRVYIEYIPFFMLLLAISLKKINIGFLKKGYLSLILLLIVVCQIQTYQYRYYHIHWVDMTKEKYWKVFLRIDKL